MRGPVPLRNRVFPRTPVPLRNRVFPRTPDTRRGRDRRGHPVRLNAWPVGTHGILAEVLGSSVTLAVPLRCRWLRRSGRPFSRCARPASRCGRARSIAVRCGERIRPHRPEFSQPILGVDIGAIVRLLAIIPPPAHCYLHPIPRSLPSTPYCPFDARSCSGLPAKGRMHAWAPQPAFRCQRTDYRALAWHFAPRPRQAFRLLKLRKHPETSRA
jgi:hypothetical protein